MNLPLTEWLSQRDSHTAYGVEILKELMQFYRIKAQLYAGKPQVMLSRPRSKRTSYINGQSGKEFVKSVGRVPKGPVYAAPGTEDEAILFGGWQLTAAIRKLLTGTYTTCSGRGGAFRDDLAAIKKWEEKEVRRLERKVNA